MGKYYDTLKDKRLGRNISVVLILVGLICAYPVINTLFVSISSGFMADRGKVYFIPREVNFDSWSYIFRDTSLWRSMANSIFVTIIGTIISLLITSMFAYSLANKKLHKKVGATLSFLIIFTMIFRYPIIPYFLSIRSYGLMDSLWALILPHAVVAYNLIILRTFFRQMPDSLEESAIMEGAGFFRILFQIILPLAKPALATIGLFYAVSYWNLFLHTILFIRSDHLMTLQPKLRMMLDAVLSEEENVQTIVNYSGLTIRAAVIMFATMPIIIIYPFLQKHFVKGAMLGSVKG
ncbi:MAG: carbohydrate ABC transporter permease [Spirochaetaceae bacterium]